jgi:hypothetical protein
VTYLNVACAYEGVDVVNTSFFRRLELRLLLRLVLPFACSPILALFCLPVPRFTSFNVRLPRIVATLRLQRLKLLQSLSFAWKNRMNMEEPHAHMRESTKSTSASSFSLLRQLLRQLFTLVSSSIDSFFPSFRIHGIVVANRRLS